MTPPIIANTNFQDWMNWQRVTDPSGTATYFVVPGYGDRYVFDPYQSNAMGKIMLYENPKPVYDKIADQQKAEKEQGSLPAQLAPVGGALAGAYLTKQVADMVTAGGAVANAAAPVASAAAPVAGAIPSAIAMGGSGGAGSTGALAAGGQVSGGAGIAPATGGFGSMLSGAIPIAGVAAGTYLGGKAAMDMLKGEKPNLLGRATLGIATGGLSEVAKATGLLGRKSTKDYQKERWGDLLDRGVAGAEQAQQANHGNTTGAPSAGWEQGEAWSFEKALNLTKENPDHFALAYGNLDTFGNDWLGSYTNDQRRAIVSNLAHEGLYAGNKGDIVIKDKDKAIEIKDKVLSGQLGIRTSGEPQQQAMAVETENLKPIQTETPFSLNTESLGAANRMQMQPAQSAPQQQAPQQRSQPAMLGGLQVGQPAQQIAGGDMELFNQYMNSQDPNVQKMAQEAYAQFLAKMMDNPNQPLGQGKPAGLTG